MFSLPTEVCKTAVSKVGVTSSLATAPPPIHGLVQEMVHDLKVLLVVLTRPAEKDSAPKR